MVRVHIDESGTIGNDGKYFVITALITHNDKASKRIRRLVQKAKLKSSLSELKGSGMSFAQKQKFISRLIAQNDYSIAYIVVDKKPY